MSTTHTLQITSVMNIGKCAHCDARFIYDRDWLTAKLEQDLYVWIYCAKGHANSIRRGWDKQLHDAQSELADARRDVRELSKKLTRALHVIDQNNLPDPEPTETGTGEIEDARTSRSWLEAAETGTRDKPFVCPKCRRIYKVRRFMCRHIWKAHNVDPSFPFIGEQNNGRA